MDRLKSIINFCKTERVRPNRYSDKVMEAFRRSSRKHAIKYPDRILARKARFKFGVEPCVVCSSVDNIDRHHPDYNKPDNIVFLCRTHHHELHSWDSN